jgi:hypothetical protein
VRARNLKPGLFLNEKLGSAEPLYSLIFAGLWCLADREGRLEDRPLRIHASINPYRPCASTVQALDWLVQEKFLARYAVLGVQYLAVLNFRDHQQPHVKEASSKIPAPPKTSIHQEDTTLPGTSTGLTPGKNGSSRSDSLLLIPDSGFPIPSNAPTKKVRVKRKPEKTTIPDDFVLDADLEEYIAKNLPDADPAELFAQYRRQSEAKAWKYAKWKQAFQEYVRNARSDSGHFAAGQYPKRPHSKPISWS